MHVVCHHRLSITGCVCSVPKHTLSRATGGSVGLCWHHVISFACVRKTSGNCLLWSASMIALQVGCLHANIITYTGETPPVYHCLGQPRSVPEEIQQEHCMDILSREVPVISWLSKSAESWKCPIGRDFKISWVFRPYPHHEWCLQVYGETTLISKVDICFGPSFGLSRSPVGSQW